VAQGNTSKRIPFPWCLLRVVLRVESLSVVGIRSMPPSTLGSLKLSLQADPLTDLPGPRNGVRVRCRVKAMGAGGRS